MYLETQSVESLLPAVSSFQMNFLNNTEFLKTYRNQLLAGITLILYDASLGK